MVECKLCGQEADFCCGYRNLPRGSWRDGSFCKSCIDQSKAEKSREFGDLTSLKNWSE